MEKLKAFAFVALLGGIIFYGAYNFGKELNKDIQHKKEVDSLTMEKLKLEIELKRIELQRQH
jgi:hypothetical protein